MNVLYPVYNTLKISLINYKKKKKENILLKGGDGEENLRIKQEKDLFKST